MQLRVWRLSLICERTLLESPQCGSVQAFFHPAGGEQGPPFREHKLDPSSGEGNLGLPSWSAVRQMGGVAGRLVLDPGQGGPRILPGWTECIVRGNDWRELSLTDDRPRPALNRIPRLKAAGLTIEQVGANFLRCLAVQRF